MLLPVAGVFCLFCHRSVLRRRRVTISRALLQRNPEAENRIVSYLATDRTLRFDNSEHLCRPCWQRIQRAVVLAADVPHVPQAPPEDSEPEPENAVPEPVTAEPEPEGAQPEPEDAELESEDAVFEPQPELDAAEPERPMQLEEYSRPPNTSNACAFFECRRLSLRRIPNNIKVRLLMNYNYYVPASTRVCAYHLQNDTWDDLIEAPNVLHTFNNSQVRDIISTIKTESGKRQRLDFENIEDLDGDELYYWTGRTREEFLTILEKTPTLTSNCNCPKTALTILLSKFITGESNQRLALVFHMSRQSLERLMTTARNALSTDFVPQYLGWDHIRREDLLQRNLSLPNMLLNNSDNSKLIVICDGTYVYIYKSANFLFQMDTYSSHKFLNLLKPFLFVTTDGYIIEVTGPHSAKQSDASIINEILTHEEHPFHWFFEHGDIFVLDRGFRDCTSDLEAFGYETHMPYSVNSDETQLTTQQANDSRIVTLIRWVIEVVNGRFKRDNKLFRQEYFHNALPHMMQDFRIAAAIINCFHVPVQNSIYTEAFISRIEERRSMENLLSDYVIRRSLNTRRAAFQNMDGNLPRFGDFPRLTEQELIVFALGSYQLKLAKSYYSEHVRDSGVYTIQIHRNQRHIVEELNSIGVAGDNLWLLRGRIKSRHTRSRTYNAYIAVNNSEASLRAIHHYYCSCKAGRRTLGCCAHIMVIVWYLSYARYLDTIDRPAQFLDSIIVEY